MYLSKIHIENYRLLKDVDIVIDKSLTLVVGKNNTGKTSAMQLLNTVLEKKPLCFDDYPLSCRKEVYELFKQYWAEEINSVDLINGIPETKLRLAALEFLSDDATYSTDHGVKGEEYENVFMVMGRGWNLYKFEEFLYKDENRLSGKDLDAYIRNRNLFYVCCSRPKKRLAILITVPINTQFRNYLADVFGANSIISYTDFMKKCS